MRVVVLCSPSQLAPPHPTPSYFLRVKPRTTPPGQNDQVLCFYSRAATLIVKPCVFTVASRSLPSVSGRLPFASGAAPDQIRRPGKGAIFSDENRSLASLPRVPKMAILTVKTQGFLPEMAI